jgi:hypothetical protein
LYDTFYHEWKDDDHMNYQNWGQRICVGSSTFWSVKGAPLVVAYGSDALAAAIVWAHDAAANASVTIIGIVRFASIKRWRVAVAPPGHEPIWVSQHHRRTEAEAQVKTVKEALQHGPLTETHTWRHILATLAARSTDSDHLS